MFSFLLNCDTKRRFDIESLSNVLWRTWAVTPRGKLEGGGQSHGQGMQGEDRGTLGLFRPPLTRKGPALQRMDASEGKES